MSAMNLIDNLKVYTVLLYVLDCQWSHTGMFILHFSQVWMNLEKFIWCASNAYTHCLFSAWKNVLDYATWMKQ